MDTVKWNKVPKTGTQNISKNKELEYKELQKL